MLLFLFKYTLWISFCVWEIRFSKFHHPILFIVPAELPVTRGKIAILKSFWKDHMTLKTEEMAAENSALPSQEWMTC